MSLIYDEPNTTQRYTSGFSPERCDATKLYLSHYDNGLTLTFFLQNGNAREKSQASKELVMCERKQAYWARQANFDERKALAEIQKLKRKWA